MRRGTDCATLGATLRQSSEPNEGEIIMQQPIRQAFLRPGRAAAACLLAAVVLAQPGRAQTPPKIDCATATKTHELNWCSEKALEAADKKLNDTYKRVLAHIAKADGLSRGDRDKWAAALRTAQRHWLAFRDQDRGEVVAFEWGGGTGTTGAILGCKLTKTGTRTKELDERLPQ